MKKLLFTTLLSLGFILPASAFDVTMDYQTETLIDQQTNVVERALLLKISDPGTYTIEVKPLDKALTNGSIDIPLTNVYINNTVEDIYLNEQMESTLCTNKLIETGVLNLTAKIKNYGMVPKGAYTLNFQVIATEAGGEVQTSVFNLMLNIPTYQSIDNRSQQAKITLTAENAFDKTQKVTNETSPMVYINSNADWELSLNTDNFEDNAGNYYVRVISASSSDIEKLQERVLLQPGKEIILAKGKAPTENGYVTIEYSLENKDGKIIRAGSYENRLKYILREKG